MGPGNISCVHWSIQPTNRSTFERIQHDEIRHCTLYYYFSIFMILTQFHKKCQFIEITIHFVIKHYILWICVSDNLSHCNSITYMCKKNIKNSGLWHLFFPTTYFAGDTQNIDAMNDTRVYKTLNKANEPCFSSKSLVWVLLHYPGKYLQL